MGAPVAVTQAQNQPETGTQPTWTAGPDTFPMFKDFLFTVYPELKQSSDFSEFSVTSTTDSEAAVSERHYNLKLLTFARPSSFAMQHGKDAHQPTPCPSNPEDEGAQVMQSSITYSGSLHRILGFTNVSEYANGKKLARAQEAVREHLQWNGEQIADYLKKSGAKYGPWNKSEIVRKIPLEQLTPFLGKLTLDSVQFVNIVPEGNVGGGPHPLLLWEAVVSTYDPQFGEIQLKLFFEPFEGKLHSIIPIQRSAQTTPKE
jgi:hypothetical protein